MSQRLCLALDDMQEGRAYKLTEILARYMWGVKVHDFIDGYGPDCMRKLKQSGARKVCADMKLFDMPRSAARRVKRLIENGADAITAYACDKEMLRVAADAAEGRAEIWAVLIPSWMTDEQISRIFGGDNAAVTCASKALDFMLSAHEAGIRTFVCSAQEVGFLSKIHHRGQQHLRDKRFVAVGTRSEGAELNGQSRSATQLQALTDGAEMLILGSEVTTDKDPISKFMEIREQIAPPKTVADG